LIFYRLTLSQKHEGQSFNFFNFLQKSFFFEKIIDFDLQTEKGLPFVGHQYPPVGFQPTSSTPLCPEALFNECRTERHVLPRNVTILYSDSRPTGKNQSDKYFACDATRLNVLRCLEIVGKLSDCFHFGHRFKQVKSEARTNEKNRREVLACGG